MTGERSRARAIESGKMRSDHSGSAIGHRFAAVYCFGPFAAGAVFCFFAALLLYKIVPELLGIDDIGWMHVDVDQSCEGGHFKAG